MIIALTGKKQNGKSTAAKYIAEKYGFVRVNFKDALIAEIKQNFPKLLKILACFYFPDTGVDDVTPEMIDWLFEEKPEPVRALMQNYGTEVRRGDDPYYWANKWAAEASKYKNVVCDDARFPEEVEAVELLLGHVIRVVRSDYENTDTHASETEMDKIIPDDTITVATGETDKLFAYFDEIITSRVQHQ